MNTPDKIVNLPMLRKGLNAGNEFKISFYRPHYPHQSNCVVSQWGLEKKAITGRHNIIKQYSEDISDIITPDKADLLLVLMRARCGLLLKKIEDKIVSSLVQNYTDPMDLMVEYYNLPFLSVQHEKLKTSLHRINEYISTLGTSAIISAINNENRYGHEISYNIYLPEEGKVRDHLILTKRINPNPIYDKSGKIRIPDYLKQNLT